VLILSHLALLLRRELTSSLKRTHVLLILKIKVLRLYYTQGLYLLPFTLNTTTVLNSITRESIWHQQLGHLGDTTLKHLSNALQELPKEDTIIESNNSKECETCLKSKFKATISREPSTKRTEFLQLITSALCGPLPIIGLGGYRYFMTFLDMATR